MGGDRRPRLIDDGDIVFAHPGGDPDLLHALQQAVINFAVGRHFAAQGVEIGAAVLQGQRLFLHRGDAFLQLRLLQGLGLEAALDPGGNGCDLGGDLLVEFVDLRLELQHARILRLDHAQLLAVFRLKLAGLLLEALDHAAGRHLLQTVRAGLLDALVGGFGGDALRLDPHQPGAHLPQLGAGDFQAVLGIDDLAFTGIGGELAFRRFQGGARPVHLLLQELLGVGGGVEAQREIKRHVVGGEGVGDLGGARRILTGVVHAHQARVPHRLHGQPFEKQVLGAMLGLIEGRLGRERGRGRPAEQGLRLVAQGLPGRGGRREVRLRRERQLVDHAPRQRPTGEQLVLGLVKIAIGLVSRRLVAGDVPVVDDLRAGGLDLHQQGGAVLRHGEGGHHQPRGQGQGGGGEQDPTAADQQRPQGAQINHIRVGRWRGGRGGGAGQRYRLQGGVRAAHGQGGLGRVRGRHGQTPGGDYSGETKPRNVPVTVCNNTAAPDSGTRTLSFAVSRGSRSLPASMAAMSTIYAWT